MQTLNILGVPLVLGNLRESLNLTQTYLTNGAPNTILYLTSKMVVQASKEEEYRNYLESMDLLVCADVDILRASNIAVMGKQNEIEKHYYLFELCKKINRNNMRVVFLSDSEENLFKISSQFQALLRSDCILAQRTLDSFSDNEDDIANELNNLAPTIIISNLPTLKQESLMLSLKPYLNLQVWLGLSSDINFTNSSHFSFHSLTKRVYQKYFQKKVNRYQAKSEDEKIL